MATTKKAAATGPEESFIEKVGHKIGEITGAVAEKYNELMHPDSKKKTAKARPRPVSKKGTSKKTTAKKTAPSKKAVVTKAAAKKAIIAAANKQAARKK